MITISSWGKLEPQEHNVIFVHERNRIAELLEAKKSGLPHGMGRSYGDVCLNPGGTLWKSTFLNRFISFDKERGVLACESGLLLKEIHSLTIPQGWMLPVSPGTQFITVGGAIANDIHGKNHHVYGTFGEHVRKLTLVRTDGQVIECGPHLRANWFKATVGGLGLTGFISTVELQLRPVNGPWLEMEMIPYSTLEGFYKLSDASEENWEYTASWIDCLSGNKNRGIFLRANHSSYQDQNFSARSSLTVPPLRFSCVNRLTLKLLNSLYFFWKKNHSGRKKIHYIPFCYPLDNPLEWNRLYGRKGFYQYQCVIPAEFREEAIHTMLKMIAGSSEGSFFSVLKTFGKRNPVGMLSFPREGVTLALDFANRGSKTLRLFEQLDAIVHEYNGSLYPAKDARMPKWLFEAGYPQLSDFIKFRDSGISSSMSRRLFGQ